MLRVFLDLVVRVPGDGNEGLVARYDAETRAETSVVKVVLKITSAIADGMPSGVRMYT